MIRYAFLLVPIVLLALVSACATTEPAPTPTFVPTVEGWQTEAVATLGTPAPIPLTMGLPYRPDVQFAPLYLAQERGYYTDRGFDVSFEYGDEATFVRLVAAREKAAAIASGEQVILARSQGIPVTYVMTWYQQFAGAVFSGDTTIEEPADLVGLKVGLPAASGASYTGWQALLYANDIDPLTVQTEVIGFEQLQAVLQGRVDAAVGYVANEPVQMRALGEEPSVIVIADYFNLVSNGLVVAEGMINESPDVVQALVTATMMGIRDALADPEAAFEVVLKVVPETSDPEVRDIQQQVLQESLPFWEADLLVEIDPDEWTKTQDFLQLQGMIETSTPVESMIDTRFVEAADVGR